MITKPNIYGISLLLLWGSIPFNFHQLAVGWCGVLVFAFLAVLILWGPSTGHGRLTELILWLSLAIFVSSLFSQVSDFSWRLRLWPVFLLVFSIWLAMSRVARKTQLQKSLRRAAITAAILFAGSMDWVLHTREYDATPSAYFGSDLLFTDFHLSRPYDYYCVLLPMQAIACASAVALLLLSAAYVFVRCIDWIRRKRSLVG